MTASTEQFGHIDGVPQGIQIKIQESSADDGTYVPVVALDADLGISIGSVSQNGAWTVTADAGTNLNTSALALETGGNLATLAGAVSAGKVQVQQPDNRAVDQTINSATLNAAVTVNLNGGEGEVGFTITGLTASGAILTFEGSNNVASVSPQWGGINALSGSTISSTATADGSYRVEAGGRTAVRVRVSTTGTGTITISYSGSSASSLVSLAQSLPTGSNSIGSVTANAGTNLNTSALALETGGNLATLAGAVSASKVQTTVATALPAGTNIVGKVGIDQTTPGTTNGVQVNAALPAGQNAIGNVGGKTVSVTVTPTVTASNAYGTNYVVGGLLTFSNAFTSTGTGILQSVVMTCKKVETSGFTLFVFNGNPSNTTWTDAAVAAINANDVSLVREPISLNASSQLGTHTVAYATGLGQAMAPGSTTLYGVLIANAALTNDFGSTSDITVTVKILQDC